MGADSRDHLPKLYSFRRLRGASWDGQLSLHSFSVEFHVPEFGQTRDFDRLTGAIF